MYLEFILIFIFVIFISKLEILLDVDVDFFYFVSVREFLVCVNVSYDDIDDFNFNLCCLLCLSSGD